jgi:hypothetical protein
MLLAERARDKLAYIQPQRTGGNVPRKIIEAACSLRDIQELARHSSLAEGQCGVGFRSGEEFFLITRCSAPRYCRHSGLDLR